jgi:hypothetical protein
MEDSKFQRELMGAAMVATDVTNILSLVSGTRSPAGQYNRRLARVATGTTVEEALT